MADVIGEPTQVHYTLNIQVHVYPQHGRWYAATTQMPLMAEGADPQEAEERLLAQAVAYVRTALDHGWIDPLMRRPSLLRRVEIRRRVFISKLLRRHPEVHSRHLELA
jgi:hypothetical protein